MKAAMTFDNLNLILGAHTHHLYEYGKYINTTAGRYGEYVGEVMLRFDDFQCIQSEIMAEDVRHLSPLPGDKEWISIKQIKGIGCFGPVGSRSYLSRLQNQLPEYAATQFVALWAISIMCQQLSSIVA